MWRLNNMLLNKCWVIEEIKGEVKKKYVDTNEKKKCDIMKSTGYSNNGSKGKVHNHTSLPQDTREISNKQFTPKGTGRRTSKAQS